MSVLRCGLWQGNASVARGAGAGWLACTRDTRPPPATSSSTTQRATFHLHNHLPVQKTVCLRPAFAVPRGLPGTIARGRLGRPPPSGQGEAGTVEISRYRRSARRPARRPLVHGRAALHTRARAICHRTRAPATGPFPPR